MLFRSSMTRPFKAANRTLHARSLTHFPTRHQTSSSAAFRAVVTQDRAGGQVFATGSVYGHAGRLRRPGKNTGFVIPQRVGPTGLTVTLDDGVLVWRRPCYEFVPDSDGWLPVSLGLGRPMKARIAAPP